MSAPSMQRIAVLGPPCSGKTTTASLIARRLGVPHTELDALWWEPNWTETGAERFKQKLEDVVRGPSWVLDGNYFTVGTVDVVHPHVDTFVWLDFGRWITVPRAMRRTYGRAIKRRVLWSGNRERWWFVFRPVWLVRRGMRFHPGYNREVDEVRSRRPDATWVRLRRPGDVRRWVESLPSGG